MVEVSPLLGLLACSTVLSSVFLLMGLGTCWREEIILTIRDYT